ncbi:MAG TPA: hypothetical protein VFY12_00940 [Arenimonas sp.]|nr:hypothetical protein [Arenimonas sp.]
MFKTSSQIIQPALCAALVLLFSPSVASADCIDAGLKGVRTVLDHLYEEMESPEPTEANMEKLRLALFFRDRNALPKIPGEVTVSYAESEGGIDGTVSCPINGEMIAQPFRWTPNSELELQGRMRQ